jgi:hypothetical protein
MPNPTIDLQRDCELWCDFDTDYFDSQRNKILDRSGNGRNPEASGGPTLGVNGPDSFEAASFDGSDDFFDTTITGLADATGITLHTIVKINSPVPASEDYALVFIPETDSFGVISFKISEQFGDFEPTIILGDGDDLIICSALGIPVGEYVGLTARIDVGGDVTVLNNNDDSAGAEGNNKDISQLGPIGSNVDIGSGAVRGDGFLDGNVVFSAIWSRVLNDAEIEYLNRLTEPRRAQL